MKKKNLTRKTAAALAGLMLLGAAAPVNVHAAGGATGEDGGTTADSSISITKKEWFAVIIPTNSNLENTLNFTLDPMEILTNEDAISNQDRKIKVINYDDPRKNLDDLWDRKRADDGTLLSQNISKGMRNAKVTDYQEGVHLYFHRVDFDHFYMGNGKTNTAYDQWGNVKNREGDDACIFGNTSNWIVVANRSAVPVSVRLRANLDAEGVQVKTKESDIWNEEKPAMYIAIERTDGYTREFQTGNVSAKLIGENRDSEGRLLLGDGLSKREPLTYGPTYEEAYTIKTPNQLSEYMGFSTDDVAAIPGDIIPGTEPYKLSQDANGKITLQSNLEHYEHDNLFPPAAGDYYWISNYAYPAYGFRLYGEINQSTGWLELEKMPSVQMTWVIQTVSATDKENNTNRVYPSEYNLRGVLRDPVIFEVTHGTGLYESSSVEDVTWQYDGQDMGSLISERFPVDYSTELATYVDINPVMHSGKFTGTTEIKVNEAALLNWSRNGYFIDTTKRVFINIHLDNGETITVSLYDEFGAGNQQ